MVIVMICETNEKFNNQGKQELHQQNAISHLSLEKATNGVGVSVQVDWDVQRSK